MEQNQCTDQEIIQALDFWLQSFPDPEERNLKLDGAHYSPAEIVDHVKGGTSLGKEFLETIRTLSQKLSMDPRQVILISFSEDTQN